MKVNVTNNAFGIAIECVDVKTMRNTLRAAFRRVLSPVRRAAISNYKALFPGSQKWKGIMLSYDRDFFGASVAIVPRKSSSGSKAAALREQLRTFVLPILERGTPPRKTEKGASRGVGPKRPFFVPAKSHLTNVAETLAAELRKEVEKRAANNGLK